MLTVIVKDDQPVLFLDKTPLKCVHKFSLDTDGAAIEIFIDADSEDDLQIIKRLMQLGMRVSVHAIR